MATARARLKTCHFLKMTPELKRLEDAVYKDILAFARFKKGDPHLENLHPCLEELCDAIILIRSGAIEVESTDCLPFVPGDGIILKLNL